MTVKPSDAELKLAEWFNAYIAVSDWHAFGLSFDEVRERCFSIVTMYWDRPEFWAGIKYGCVLFYGKEFYSQYPEDKKE